MPKDDHRKPKNRQQGEDRRQSEYHYRLFTDGASITREQAINRIAASHADLSDCYGICFQADHCLIQYLNFKEMTKTELEKLDLHRVG